DHSDVRLAPLEIRVVLRLDALAKLERGGAQHPVILDGHEDQRHRGASCHVGQAALVVPPAFVVASELAVGADDDAPNLVVLLWKGPPDLYSVRPGRFGQGGPCPRRRRSSRRRPRIAGPARLHPTRSRTMVPTANTARPAPLLVLYSPSAMGSPGLGSLKWTTSVTSPYRNSPASPKNSTPSAVTRISSQSCVNAPLMRRRSLDLIGTPGPRDRPEGGAPSEGWQGGVACRGSA